MVPSVSCGGMEKPLRLSRSRAPPTGASTVKNRVSNPRRRRPAGELVGDLPVAHDVELEPVAAGRVDRLDALDRGCAERGERERDARRARRRGAGHLALGLHQAGEAGRGDAERQRRRAAEDSGRGVDPRDVLQDRGVELDVLECLPALARDSSPSAAPSA